MFGNDYITFNELYTFKKSEIQGLMTHSEWDNEKPSYVIVTNIIIGGIEFKINKEEANTDRDFPTQEREHHTKWLKYLNDVGKEAVEEKITI